MIDADDDRLGDDVAVAHDAAENTRPEPPAPSHRARDAMREHAAPACLAVLAVLAFWIVRGSLTDDSYIALTYARDLAFHGLWGMIPGEVANTMTSPLNILVLAAFTFVLRRPVLALGVVFVITTVITTYALRAAARECGFPGAVGVLGALLLVSSPLLLSTVGLEMTLAAAVLSVLLLATVRRSPVGFGLLTGLLAVTRLDLLVIAVVVAAVRPALLRGWWKILLSTAAVALPWFVFSWFFFGSAIPDTLVIKQGEGSWGKLTFSDGLRLYLDAYPLATAITVAVLIVAAAALAVWLVLRVTRRTERGAALLHPWAAVGFGGIAYYLVYTWLGVPPYHWYYAPTLITLAIFLVGAIGAVVATARRMPLRVGAAALATVGVGIFGAQAGVVAHHGLPWRFPAITTNWASAAQYARIGKAVHRIVGDDTVAPAGEVGTIAYFCHCRVVGIFSDRGYMAKAVGTELSDVGSVEGWLLRLNYSHFVPTKPLEVDYVLHWVPGYGPDPLWNTNSPWRGPGHLVLRKK